MPINTDNAHRTIRFNYTNDRDTQYELQLEYHQTNDFGPTVTIENLGEGVSLPLSFIVDAYEFLAGEGVIVSNLRPAPAKPAALQPAARGRLTPTRLPGGNRAAGPRPAGQPLGSYTEQSGILAAAGAIESFQNPQALAAKKLAAAAALKPTGLKRAKPPREMPPEEDVTDDVMQDVENDEDISTLSETMAENAAIMDQTEGAEPLPQAQQEPLLGNIAEARAKRAQFKPQKTMKRLDD
jgi:hypothetical protein